MFIEEYPDMVPGALCGEIIRKFEGDPRRGPSTVGNDGAVASGRTGTLLRIGMDTAEWRPLVEPLVPPLQAALERYAAKYEAVRQLMDREGLVCTFPPLVERVDPGQGFDWHYDQNATFADRVLACLLYLNDVDTGGATEFKEQSQHIRPTAGKIVLFPPYWTHFHRGATPASGAKYVMSCFWIYPRPERRPANAGIAQRLASWAGKRLSGG